MFYYLDDYVFRSFDRLQVIFTKLRIILSFVGRPEDGRMTETCSHQGKIIYKIIYCCVDWNQNTILLSIAKQ